MTHRRAEEKLSQSSRRHVLILAYLKMFQRVERLEKVGTVVPGQARQECVELSSHYTNQTIVNRFVAEVFSERYGESEEEFTLRDSLHGSVCTLSSVDT